MGGLQLSRQRLVQLERLHFGAICRKATTHLQHPLLERLGLLDRQREELGPVLIADLEQIREATIHH